MSLRFLATAGARALAAALSITTCGCAANVAAPPEFAPSAELVLIRFGGQVVVVVSGVS
jgi:hypothetical protein